MLPVLGWRATVAKALRRLDRALGETVVAAGPNFTAEAREILAEWEVQILSEGEHHWTDASYARIRRS